jgi:hypothetical protein
MLTFIAFLFTWAAIDNLERKNKRLEEEIRYLKTLR